MINPLANPTGAWTLRGNGGVGCLVRRCAGHSLKQLFVTLCLGILATLARGQGTLGFNNGLTSRVIFCPIDGPARYAVAADNFQMGIFVGDDAFSLRFMPELPLGLIQPGNADGIFTVPGGTVYPIPGFAQGTQPFAQVRIWGIEFGLDWEAALMTSFRYGQTDIRQLSPLGPPSGPGTVIWQSATGTGPNRFRPVALPQLISRPCIPEPGAISLMAVAGLTFGLIRWQAARKDQAGPDESIACASSQFNRFWPR